MDERNLALVAAAFERLLDKVWKSGCDTEYGRTIYFAQVDVLAILRGEWDTEYGPLAAEPVYVEVER
jgi:hypothetical protein